MHLPIVSERSDVYHAMAPIPASGIWGAGHQRPVLDDAIHQTRIGIKHITAGDAGFSAAHERLQMPSRLGMWTSRLLPGAVMYAVRAGTGAHVDIDI
jgi:hypothetical protein